MFSEFLVFSNHWQLLTGSIEYRNNKIHNQNAQTGSNLLYSNVHNLF